MDRWRGRVAVVTGASAGIGAAIAFQLQDAGMDVAALARRAHKVEEAVEAAREGAASRGRQPLGRAAAPGKLLPLQCDVSKEEDVLAAFKWIKENTKGGDILVNNAGVLASSRPGAMNTVEWRRMLDVNVLGLSVCTREALQQMKTRGVDDGHIVHVSSAAGHILPAQGEYSSYYASKHAVRVLTEGLRKELVAAKSHIRVTEVSPGLVRTDIFGGTQNDDHNALWANPHLRPEDIADSVLYALQVPPHVQIHELMVLPTGQHF